MDHGLKYKHKAINLLEKKIGETLWNQGLGKELVYLATKAQSIKKKCTK